MEFENIQDTLASRAGWLVCLPGEVYEIQITRSTSLYIIQNNKDRFDVVRMTWKKGVQDPVKETFRARNVTFETAIRKGNDYVKWLKNIKKQ